MKCEKSCGNEIGITVIIIIGVIIGILGAVAFAFELLLGFGNAVEFIIFIAAGFALAVGTMALSVRLNRAARCCFSTYGLLTIGAALLLVVFGLIFFAINGLVAGTVGIILSAIIIALFVIMLIGFYNTIDCTIEALLGCECEKECKKD